METFTHLRDYFRVLADGYHPNNKWEYDEETGLYNGPCSNFSLSGKRGVKVTERQVRAWTDDRPAATYVVSREIICEVEVIL